MEVKTLPDSCSMLPVACASATPDSSRSPKIPKASTFMSLSFRVSTRGVGLRKKNSTGKMMGRHFSKIRHFAGGGGDELPQDVSPDPGPPHHDLRPRARGPGARGTGRRDHPLHH